MANRRISELPLLDGTLVAEQDLFTVVHVFEVDPTLKNKKITVKLEGACTSRSNYSFT